MQLEHQWTTGHQAWKKFTSVHPELGYGDGVQQFYNFLRTNREELVRRDAMRRAKSRSWIAHQQRFAQVAFELATGGPE